MAGPPNLLSEILALGGTKEDFELLKGVDNEDSSKSRPKATSEEKEEVGETSG